MTSREYQELERMANEAVSGLRALRSCLKPDSPILANYIESTDRLLDDKMVELGIPESEYNFLTNTYVFEKANLLRNTMSSRLEHQYAHG